MFLDFWLVLVIVIVSGFVMEVVDAAIGMGYGTILTPVLLMMGFDPLMIVPAVLVSQLIGGLLVSFFHHKFKNVNFAIGGEQRGGSRGVGPFGSESAQILPEPIHRCAGGYPRARCVGHA